MIKIKLTAEQERALQIFKKGSTTLEMFFNARNIYKNEYAPLKDFSVDKMARLLYEPNSYEVKAEYKVEDWVTRIRDGNYGRKSGQIFKITKLNKHAVQDSEGNWHDYDNIRHATPEEVKAEQERIIWVKIGRKVGEFKDGDIYVHRNYVVPFQVYGASAMHRAAKHLTDGCITKLYPVESFVKFEDGEES